MSRIAVAAFSMIGALVAVSFEKVAAQPPDHVGPSLQQAPPEQVAGAVPHHQLILNVNQLHIMASNFGVLGNNFIVRDASLEYPGNSGYEHLTHGGLWVGAQASDGLGDFTGVATAGFDQTIGVIPPLLSEFTPASEIVRRSIDPGSLYYSPLAVSELDVIAQFDDLTPRNTSGNNEQHRPMGLEVRADMYAWSAASLRDIVFVRYMVRSQQPLTGVWLGVFTELASGPKGSYVNWPPSSGDPSGLGSWFSKKWVVYEDSLRLLREHYCAAPPIPPGCMLFRTPPWIGMKLLTPPGPGQQRTVAGWPWSPSTPWRDQDVERYALMSSGLATSFDADSLLPQSGDPVELVAIGPFTTLAPGDSAEIAVAFVGALDEETLRERARMAQRVHDVGYALALTPARASLAELEFTAGGVRLSWWSADASDPPQSVERTEAAGWQRVGAPVRFGEDRFEFLDPTARPGSSYRYRLRWDSGETAGEVAVTVPAPAPFALRVVGAQPARRAAVALGLTLPAGPAGRLEIFDVAGRRVASREVAPTGGSERIVRFAERASPGSGLFVARLTQGTLEVRTRFVVVD